jgi:hypothetical protein
MIPASEQFVSAGVQHCVALQPTSVHTTFAALAI